MNSRFWLLVAVAFVLAVCVPTAKAADDRQQIVELLDQADKAKAHNACAILHKAVSLFVKTKGEPDEVIVRRYIKVLQSTLRTRKHAEEVFSSVVVRKSRQILFQRYREQWLIDRPVRIRITIDCRSGEAAKVNEITPLTQ